MCSDALLSAVCATLYSLVIQFEYLLPCYSVIIHVNGPQTRFAAVLCCRNINAGSFFKRQQIYNALTFFGNARETASTKETQNRQMRLKSVKNPAQHCKAKVGGHSSDKEIFIGRNAAETSLTYKADFLGFVFIPFERGAALAI